MAYSSKLPDWKTFSDQQLDAAFAAYWDAGDRLTLYSSGLTSEIVSRLSSVWSFMVGAVGADRFPLYGARVGFSTTEARTSLNASASDLGASVKNVFSGISTTAMVIGAILLYAVLKK